MLISLAPEACGLWSWLADGPWPIALVWGTAAANAKEKSQLVDQEIETQKQTKLAQRCLCLEPLGWVGEPGEVRSGGDGRPLLLLLQHAADGDE